MGLCQSDTRDHANITIEIIKPNLSNPHSQNNIKFNPEQTIPLSNNTKQELHIEHENEYLMRTNININEINHSSILNIAAKDNGTYAYLSSIPSNIINLKNPSQTFQKPEEKNISNFNENISKKVSIYNRRITQMVITNSQPNISNVPYEKSIQNIINEDNKISENSDSGNIKRGFTKATLPKIATSKFLSENSTIKKAYEDNINRFNMNNIGLYDSRIFQNLVEEMDHSKEDILYIIMVVSNPCNNILKVQYYNDFVQRLEFLNNVKLITVEVTYLGLPFILTQPHFEPYNIQIRVQTPLNLKYNFLNYVISILPNEAEFLAWVDPNIEFLNENWVEETLETLRSINFVKLYKDYLIVQKDSSIVGSSSTAVKNPKNQKGYSNYEKITHLEKYSGTAWAAKKNFITAIGGFLDLCVTNECDEIISGCFEGRIEEVAPANLTPEFKDILKEWQKSIKMNNKNEDIKFLNNVAQKFILDEEQISPSKNITQKNGTKFKTELPNRYTRNEGWAMLIDNHFNPMTDLFRDERNIYQLRRDKEKMFKNFKEYYMQSNDMNF